MSHRPSSRRYPRHSTLRLCIGWREVGWLNGMSILKGWETKGSPRCWHREAPASDSRRGLASVERTPALRRAFERGALLLGSHFEPVGDLLKAAKAPAAQPAVRVERADLHARRGY